MEVSRVLFVHAVVFVLLLSPAASFGPSLLGDIARSGRVISRGATSALSSVPPGRQTLGRAITADGRILRRSGVLLMSADMDPSDESTLPTGLLEELDSAVRLNDLLLVQDFVKVGTKQPPPSAGPQAAARHAPYHSRGALPPTLFIHGRTQRPRCTNALGLSSRLEGFAFAFSFPLSLASERSTARPIVGQSAIACATKHDVWPSGSAVWASGPITRIAQGGRG